MVKLFLVFGLAALSYAFPHSNELHPQVVGGKEAGIGERPFQISIKYYGRTGDHVCGGSILNENWIITAAHCAVFDVFYGFAVQAGVHNIRHVEDNPLPLPQLVDVSKLIIHENYAQAGVPYNDIALMKLATPLVLSKENRTAIIPLAKKGTVVTGDVIVSGWGRLTSKGLKPAKLQQVGFPIVTDEVCREAYGDKIADSMICAGTGEGITDACQGDSGGPLTAIIDGVTTLVGIVSWGEKCAEPGFYGVYTEVAHYDDWITDQLAKNP